MILLDVKIYNDIERHPTSALQISLVPSVKFELVSERRAHSLDTRSICDVRYIVYI